MKERERQIKSERERERLIKKEREGERRCGPVASLVLFKMSGASG